MAKKRSLRTSREVCLRLRWDHNVDNARAAVVYRDRFGTQEELALLAFLDGGIPWTRVVEVCFDGRVVWDRERRLDLIFGSGESTLADRISLDAPEQAPPSDVFPLQPFRYDSVLESWEPADDPPAPVSSLRVATFNVLFDLHEAERIHTRRRIPEILRALDALDADVICLQEVTKRFLEALLEAPWVRGGYACSDGPSAYTVEPYGQLLLSRTPLTNLRVCHTSEEKRFLVGEVTLASGPLLVATAHFTSNRAPDAAQRRAAEAARLLEVLGDADALVAADFNEREPDVPLEGFADLWTALRGDADGFTFEPDTNALASLMSRSGRPGRFDRVLVRSQGLVPRSVRRFAREPIGMDLFASDHCGVLAELSLGTDARPTYRSALVALPPESLWPTIQELRQVHDKSFARWPPHVNLLYGFVPPSVFDAAAATLRDALADVPPFAVSLARFGLFEHKRSATLWLDPETDPAGALHDLQARLLALFPQCARAGSAPARPSGGDKPLPYIPHSDSVGAGLTPARPSGGDEPLRYTPHLSVGQCAPDEAQALAQELQDDWAPLRFVVREVHLIAREGDDPFSVRHTVSLGGPRWIDAEDDVREAAKRVLARHGADLHLLRVGSVALGVASDDGDLDLLCVGPRSLSREAFFAAVSEAVDGPARVTGGRVPVLELGLYGTGVDLLYARLPEGVAPAHPTELDDAAMGRCDFASRAALLACLDGEAILAAVHGQEPGFRALLRRVKRWARARNLDDAACGMLGGLCWAIMTAALLADDGTGEGDALLERFFERYASWPWPEPVALAGATCELKKTDVLPVLTPSSPSENAARNVTRGTREILASELARALETLRTRPDELEAEYVARDSLVLRVEGEEGLGAARGWVRGNALSLVLALERTKARVRPGPRGVDLSLQLDRTPLDARIRVLREFKERFEAWPERPAGAKLVILDGD